MKPPEDTSFLPERPTIDGSLPSQANGPFVPFSDSPTPARPSILLHDASLGDMVRALRTLVGLTPDEPAPGEFAARLGPSLPTQLSRLDADAWLAWCVTGLPLFDDAFPTLRQVRTEASRIAMALAMLRERGNLSAAARLLDSSRKVLRDNLRVTGLYPWHRGPDSGDDSRATPTKEAAGHPDVVLTTRPTPTSTTLSPDDEDDHALLVAVAEGLSDDAAGRVMNTETIEESLEQELGPIWSP